MPVQLLPFVHLEFQSHKAYIYFPNSFLFNLETVVIHWSLQANADASVISCMHNLSRRIAIALQHEERRCQYLTREAKLMLAVQEEITTGTESEIQSCHTRISVVLLFCTEQCWTLHTFSVPIEGDGNPQSPFRQILPKCKLARDLKEAYDRCVWVLSMFFRIFVFLMHRISIEYMIVFVVVFCSLCTTGVVRLHINSWLEVSFCLPHKIHRIGGNYIPPEALERSLKAIRCDSSLIHSLLFFFMLFLLNIFPMMSECHLTARGVKALIWLGWQQCKLYILFSCSFSICVQASWSHNVVVASWRIASQMKPSF